MEACKELIGCLLFNHARTAEQIWVNEDNNWKKIYIVIFLFNNFFTSISMQKLVNSLQYGPKIIAVNNLPGANCYEKQVHCSNKNTSQNIFLVSISFRNHVTYLGSINFE